eukprot:6623184-Alexandrium_andersonii.AAC.1
MRIFRDPPVLAPSPGRAARSVAPARLGPARTIWPFGEAWTAGSTTWALATCPILATGVIRAIALRAYEG